MLHPKIIFYFARYEPYTRPLPTIKTTLILKTTIFLIIILFSTACDLIPNQTITPELENLPCEIELTSKDDKCGEWGGNLEIIRLFQKNCEGEFYIEYKLRKMDCEVDPIIHYKRTDFDKKKVVLSTIEDRKLIMTCIAELKEMNKSNTIKITHSGIVNEVKSSDSTIILKDYPSKEWLAFNRLKKRITEK